jgi:hypothetical protein
MAPTLLTSGFPNPSDEEAAAIMASFHDNCEKMRHLTNNQQRELGLVMEIDHGDNFVTVGSDGLHCRFILLEVDQIIKLFNNPNSAAGLKAVPRLDPVCCFFNNGLKHCQVLYACNGYIIVVADSFLGVLAEEFVDPSAIERKIPHTQRIPRPPNA